MTKARSAWRRLADKFQRRAEQPPESDKVEIAPSWRPSDVETDIPLRFPIDHIVADAKRACAAGDLEKAIGYYPAPRGS